MCSYYVWQFGNTGLDYVFFGQNGIAKQHDYFQQGKVM